MANRNVELMLSTSMDPNAPLQTNADVVTYESKDDTVNNPKDEYDVISQFESINYLFETVVLIFALGIGFIIAICVGDYNVILPIAVSLTFAHLIYVEWYGEKSNLVIPGELKQDINNSLKKPEEVEFYLRSDFVDVYERPRGSTIIYVLKDAPGALMVHEHRMLRLAGLKGFEIGGGIGACILLIVSIVIGVLFMPTLSCVFFVILMTYLGCLSGSSIEYHLRKHKLLPPVDISQTYIRSIPFYAIGNVETHSLNFNQSRYFTSSNVCFERYSVWCFRIVDLIYSFFLHIISICFSNSFLTLWFLVTILLILCFVVHVKKDTAPLYGTFVYSWLVFGFSLFMSYYLSSPAWCQCIKLPKLGNGKMIEKRLFFFLWSLSITIALLVVSLLLTNVASKFYNLKIVISNEPWKQLNCKTGSQQSSSSSRTSDICNNINYNSFVTVIVILCLVWIVVPILGGLYSKLDKSQPADGFDDKRSARIADLHQFKLWKFRHYAEVVLHRRKTFGLGQLMWKWIDFLSLRIWNFSDNALHFPVSIELARNDAKDFHEYLVKKLQYYRPLEENPNVQMEQLYHLRKREQDSKQEKYSD